MKKNEESRKADGWIITHSLHVGDKEVVFGEDKNNAETPYMCGFCESNEILRSYSDCIGGDDYLEIMQLYIERINGQIEAVKEEIAHTPVSVEPITADQCYQNDLSKSINGKIVALKADVLRHEYRIATYQILLVNGGFGAAANARGSAVFVTNLYNGEHYRVERCDLLGAIKPEHVPPWALEKAIQVKERDRQKQEPAR